MLAGRVAPDLPVTTDDVVSVPPEVGVVGDFSIYLTILGARADSNIDSDDTGSNATAQSKGTSRSYHNMPAEVE